MVVVRAEYGCLLPALPTRAVTQYRQTPRLHASSPPYSQPLSARQGLPLECPLAVGRRLQSRQAQQQSRRRAAVLEQQELASEIQIDFSNSEDSKATVISLSGHDRPDLLHVITGAIGELQLNIVSASTSTLQDEQAVITLRVTAKGEKVTESSFEGIEKRLRKVIMSGSSQSTMPSIYGEAVSQDTKRLRPLSYAVESDAGSLESAAAELSKAASLLVSIERHIISMQSDGADARALETSEAERSEAAATLERRLAAMEASLAARRAPREAPAAPAAARGPGAEFRFQQGGATSSGPAAGLGYEIILQAFNWESHRQNWYQELKSRVGQIVAAGYTSMWLPPPSDSVSQQGYLPRDLYNLNSCYGSEGDLRDCISVLHENNLKVIADIVINHRCAHTQDAQGLWNKFGGRLPWGPEAICSNNAAFGGTGQQKQGEDYTAAPNIDHTQQRVREDIKGWMKWLRSSIGFDGWRFDFVKGYRGEVVREYLNATVPEMAFGEFWDTCEYTDGVLNYNQDSHRQRITNWCDQTGGTAAAFDFTTKGVLQEAVARREYWRLVDNLGRPPGMMGMWPSRAVTFIENHDTGSTLNHWPFPISNLPEGYAYLLTHPGTPCVFWDHWLAPGLGDSINKLLKCRQQHSLHCRSKVMVHKASADVYAASVDGRIAVKIGPGDWSPGTGNVQVGQRDWVLNCSGHQFAVWDAIR